MGGRGGQGLLEGGENGQGGTRGTSAASLLVLVGRFARVLLQRNRAVEDELNGKRVFFEPPVELRRVPSYMLTLDL